MRPHEHSPSSSPSRKRARLSSPTYDDQYLALSQEDLNAFDEIEARLSQPSLSKHGPMIPTARHRNIDVDDDNPFIVKAPPKQPHFQTASAAFTSASLVDTNIERSPSPDAPPEVDYNAWFKPASQDLAVAFQPVGSVNLSSASAGISISAGFQTASKKGLLAPSHAALLKAKKMMEDIWSDDPPSTTQPGEPTHRKGPHSPIADRLEEITNNESNPTFHRVTNTTSIMNPTTPLPNTRASQVEGPGLSQSPAAMIKGKGKPFVPPSRTTLSQVRMETPRNNAPTASAFSAASSILYSSSQHSALINPAQGVKPPMQNAPRPFTPVKSLGVTPRTPFVSGKRGASASFITPFKNGMKPGEPGHESLRSSLKKDNLIPLSTAHRDRSPRKAKQKTFFTMTSTRPRVPLAQSDLYPQQYTDEQLEGLGINYVELRQMTPEMAIYYSFHTSSVTPSATANTLLGASAALDHLLSLGCNLATKAWVDNHWSLILWKLAGLVLLDPMSEREPTKKRWCWSEVIRQLLYRYERELNCGIRPALRLVTTQDAPAGCPMTLSVSKITWTQPELTDDGDPIPSHVELEVTDGWYRLRAQVDGPLTRAIKRDIIQVGRKISVAGTRLSSERKDPSEVLEAYNSTKLILFGNSSHLAPWHAKLGFNSGACISTLHSLTPDGGAVAAIDAIIVQVHPVAFLELVEDPDGRRRNEGPRNEAEEAQQNAEWQKRRERHFADIRNVLEKKWMHIEKSIDRLERRAGSTFRPRPDEFPPDRIDGMYDDLEEPSATNALLTKISPKDARWLAIQARKRLEMERERSHEEIELELKTLCPPRNVRSFRVIVVEDAQTRRRPKNRRAQLTVWDVMGLQLGEEGPSLFEIGKRYLITNLVPTQQKAWMGTEEGAEIYLATRRDSKWMKIKT